MITLDDGKQIKIVSFMMERTYDPFTMGLPSDELNKSILEKSPEWAKKMWGDHSIHIITPPTTMVERGQETVSLLPERKNAVLLDGPATDGKSFGGMLVVIYFNENVLIQGVRDNVEEALKDLNWAELARNYEAKV